MPRRRRLFERREITRHGKTVWYFRRRRGGPRIRLPDDYGSKVYIEAYERALKGLPTETAPEPAGGTLRWLVDRYRTSGHFASLAPTSRVSRGYIMEAVCRDAGHVDYHRITRQKIQEGMNRRAAKPHAANNFLVAMSVLFKWALEHELVNENPCDGVARRKDRIKGFHTWEIEEVEAFRAKHPIGTKPRLAMDLLLFTGLRRADVINVGRQHVRNGTISLRTGKTKAMVHLPVFAELQASIDATRTGDMVFLTNAKGEPFANPQAFGMWFIRHCRAAGLGVGRTAHGLRKAGATIAANNGATTHELMAMFGWSRVSMAEVYTKQADRQRLARAASERIANNAVPHPAEVAGSKAKNASEIVS
jgi:integrase